MNILLKAAQFAKKAHAKQFRKNNETPYILHPARVASRVMILEDATEEMVIAAFNHDAVEDSENPKQTYQDLLKEFGSVVANYVDELTNKFTKKAHPELKRKARKAKEAERLGNISVPAKIIKMIDRLDNLSDLDLDDDFSEVYLEESLELWKNVQDGHVEIARELREAIFDLKWKIHSAKCRECEHFPVSKACKQGTQILREIT
jgi:(p)ppGpp synthase/HD superfamily hydrolase